MNIKQNLNDIYKGIYFYSLIKESKETAKSSLSIRMIGLLFLYYFGTFILCYKIYLNKLGNRKLSVLGAIFFIFIVYLILYRFLVKPILPKEDFEDIDHIDDVDMYKRKALVAFLFALVYVVFCGIGIDIIYTYLFLNK